MLTAARAAALGWALAVGAMAALGAARECAAQRLDAASGISASATRSSGTAGVPALPASRAAFPDVGRASAGAEVSSGIEPDAPRRSPWYTPLASAARPGAGQAVLRQDRFVAYMAVEGYFWLRYFADRREARREREAYRQLANDVARAFYSDAKPVGDFEYYERMEQYIESGVYDVIPGGTLQPETDTTTFNGSVWLLARRTYWTNPELPPDPGSEAYLRAEALYQDRAIAPEFRWSWRDAQLEQDLYRRTISRSNEAFRRSVQDLGVVLANHVLSTVDAYVSVRLQRSVSEPDRFGATLTVPW